MGEMIKELQKAMGWDNQRLQFLKQELDERFSTNPIDAELLSSIEALLNKLGVPRGIGRLYIKEALSEMVRSEDRYQKRITTQLIPIIANKHGLQPSAVKGQMDETIKALSEDLIKRVLKSAPRKLARFLVACDAYLIQEQRKNSCK